MIDYFKRKVKSMAEQEAEYFKIKRRRFLHEKSKDLVTVRSYIVKGKSVMALSIGTNLCERLELLDNARVNIYIDKKDRNIFMIKKSEGEGYKLSSSHHKANFKHFQFRYESEMNLKLSQAVIAEHKIINDMLIINIKSLRVDA